MKAFWHRYSYIVIKLFLNQFAIAVFGVALALACGKAENTRLQIVTSVFAILFYLFLLYAAMWEVGAKDGITAQAHHTSRGLWRGFVIALCANALNYLLAILTLPGAFAPGTAADGISAAAQLIALLIEGMFIGVLALPFRGLLLHDFAWVYFVTPLFSVAVCGVAYILGSFNLHFTNILIPKNKDVKNNGRPE